MKVQGAGHQAFQQEEKIVVEYDATASLGRGYRKELIPRFSLLVEFSELTS